MVFASVYGPPFVREGAVRRDATMDDYENFVKLSQAFPELDSPGGTIVEPNDRPLDSRHLDMVYALQTLSDKPYMGSVISGPNALDTIEMGKILFGGPESLERTPASISLINCNSPLRWDDRMLSAMLEYNRANQAVITTPFLLMGAMSPVSIPATLVQQIAEALTGIALTQLVRPGCPVVFGSFLSNTDMQSGSPSFGTPESAIGLLCTGQIARRFGLPWRSGGGLTSSQTPDAQSSYEALMTMLPTFLAGANFVMHSAGWLEGGLVSCYEKFIIDVEILRMLRHEFTPLEIDEESLAFGAHEEVGSGGHFLGAMHTLERFRECFYRPLLSSTENFDRWTKKGGHDAADRAGTIYRETLEAYERPPLDEGIDQELQEYVDPPAGGAGGLSAIAMEAGGSNGLIADRAYEALRDRIVTLRLAPGTLLREDELMRELGIGRTPLREAIKRLAHENLVAVAPRSGTFVTSVDAADIIHISEVRAELEAQAAELAALRMDASTRERAEALLEEVQTLERAADADALMRLDETIHRLAWEARAQPVPGGDARALLRALQAHLVRRAGPRARPRRGRVRAGAAARGDARPRPGPRPRAHARARARVRARDRRRLLPRLMLPEHPDHLWRTPEPRPAYEVVIVGAGGHGLATAYYLAKNHGITDVAVLERGWLGGGNMGRNTTIIRSNYLWDESAAIYEHSLKLWEGLSEELGYDILFSQRGVLNLAHNLSDVREGVRRVEANRLNGVDAEWLDAEEVKAFCPIVSISPAARYPVLGATLQPRGGIAKHDHVAWGYARAADALGVDLIQGCEVTGLDIQDGRMRGVQTSRGPIRADRVALAAAGHSSVLAEMAGLRLPIQSHPLQALVSELLEPVLDCVVMSNAVHVYVSQAHKGELVMGAGVDAYNGYGQRGALHVIEAQLAAALELFPIFAARARAAHLGRDRRRDARRLGDPRADPGRGPVRQLRLGDGRLQGDARGRLGVRAHDRPRRAAPARRAVRARALPHRRADRRARRRRRGPLMLRIPCPYCGERDETEFAYGGEAHVPYPGDPDALDDDAWSAYLFVRANPKGRFAERWCHSTGCRRWFNVIRDTATYEVQSAYRIGESRAVSAPPGRGRPRRPLRPAARSRSTARSWRGCAATRWPRRCSPRASTWSRTRSPTGARAGSSPRGRRSPTRSSRSQLAGGSEPMLRATEVELFDGLRAREPERARAPGGRAPTAPATTTCTCTATCSWWAPGPPASPRPTPPPAPTRA